ncbi:hypothetical protein C8R46DRAFT_1309514, partial [Mycena filopes]
LEGETAFTQERLESCRSPILDVPTEITCEIFTHFLPVYPLCPPLTGNKSPTLLTQVCRAWREIALSTPKLWRAMLLPPLAGVSTERQLQRVDLWVERSGSCPLSIEIPYRHESEAVLERVFQHASRLEQLNAIVPAHSILKSPRSLPMLRRLDLSLDSWPVPQEYLLFSDAPELRTVILDHTAILGAVLRWSQLTSVTLKAVYPHECAPVLQQTPLLQFCELQLVSSVNADWPEIQLPCLVVLTLTCDTEDSDGPVTGYLEILVVPSLRSLEVPELLLGDDPIATLTSFIAKSGCQLQELRITGEITDEHLYRVAFPRIQSLSFHTSGSESGGSAPEMDELGNF